MTRKQTTYKDAGVDIDAGKRSVELIGRHVQSTHTGAVLAGVGAFGGLIDLTEIIKGYKNPVLAQSIDGVGTKLMVATLAGNHTTIGMDIVNHGCDDVLCQGARPVTFLDYVAMSRLSPEQMEEIVRGMAEACRAAGVAILGGETAELPGMYRENEYDVAGVVTGVVERDRIVTGASIAAGHALVGLASNGLHTNGYTLARKVLLEQAGLRLDETPDGLDAPVGETLLRPHINYAPAVLDFLDAEPVHGMAHITGGGLVDNLTRVLPQGCRATVRRGSWPVTPVFNLIQNLGNVPQDDMERSFNMGIGYVLILEDSVARKAVDFFTLRGHPAYRIGEIVSGECGVELVDP